MHRRSSPTGSASGCVLLGILAVGDEGRVLWVLRETVPGSGRGDGGRRRVTYCAVKVTPTVPYMLFRASGTRVDTPNRNPSLSFGQDLVDL